MKTYNFKVKGINCDACLKLIKKKIGKVEGVADVDVTLTTDKSIGTLTFKSEKDLPRTRLEEALEDTEYQLI